MITRHVASRSWQTCRYQPKKCTGFSYSCCLKSSFPHRAAQREGALSESANTALLGGDESWGTWEEEARLPEPNQEAVAHSKHFLLLGWKVLEQTRFLVSKHAPPPYPPTRYPTPPHPSQLQTPRIYIARRTMWDYASEPPYYRPISRRFTAIMQMRLGWRDDWN